MTNFEMQTGQTDLRVKSAKLNFYSKAGPKKMKSTMNYAKNMTTDDKSAMQTMVRTSGCIVMDKGRRPAEEYDEPNMSMLKSEETNILENIAVNFEMLNNSLSKSLTPCLSNRNPNAVRLQQRANDLSQNQKKGAMFCRTVGLTTPHRGERDGTSFVFDGNDNQFVQTQPIGGSTNVFNFQNVNRSYRTKNEFFSRHKMRRNFNSTNQSSGTMGTMNAPNDTALLSL